MSALRTEALRRATLMLASVGYEYRIELKGEVIADTLPKAKRDMQRFAIYADEINAAVDSPEGTVGEIFLKPESDITLSQLVSNLSSKACQRLGKGSIMAVANKERQSVEWMRLTPKESE